MHMHACMQVCEREYLGWIHCLAQVEIPRTDSRALDGKDLQTAKIEPSV